VALLVGGAALALVAFAYLTPPPLFDGTDWLQLHLPNKTYMAEALRDGRLPLWNPYVSLGRPFLADIETGVLYPPNLLYLLLDPTTALVVLTVAHYALGLVGMLVLGRVVGLAPWAAWLAGGSFLWSAPVVARLSAGQVPYAQATCYVPLLFALAARVQTRPSPRRIAALAALLALQLLCGHPQIAWITWVGLGAFVLGRALPPEGTPLRAGARGVVGLGVAVAAALALSGPMLLPFLELVAQGNRAAPSLAFAGGGSMEWWQWTSLVWPDGGRRIFYWEQNLYGGLLPVVLGAAGLAQWRDRNARGLLATALVGAVLAMGTRTPIFAVLYHVLPGVSSFRLHCRASVLVVFALTAAASLFLSRKEPAGRVVPWLLAGVALATGGPLAFRAIAPQPEAASEPFPFARLALAGAVAAAGGFALLARSDRAATVGRVVLAALAIGELGVSWGPARRAWDLPVARAGEPLIREALRQAGLYPANGTPPRVAVPPWVARQNAGMLYKWANVAGYNALTLDRVWVYLHEAVGVEASVEDNTYPSKKIYDLGPFPYDSTALVAGWDPRRGLVLRHDPDPRVYLVAATRRVRDWREAVDAMSNGHPFHRVALVEADVSLPPDPPGGGAAPPGRAAILSFAPERVVLRAEASVPSLLVLAEAWYPGWAARVDGTPAPCLPANGWMRAVPVPAGRHTVELRFRSRWLLPGTLLSLAAAAALVLWARGRGAGSTPAPRPSSARSGRAVPASSRSGLLDA
jgi:hypothetical protein